MFIYEAAAQAMAQGRRMQRRNGAFWRTLRVRPTNTPDCCLIEMSQEAQRVKGPRKPAPHWNPSAEDLLADDWEVVD